MHITTLIGIIAALSAITSALLAKGDLWQYIHIPSLLIVFGGTTAVVLLQINMEQFASAIRLTWKSTWSKEFNPRLLIAEAIALAAKIRREGLLSLEEEKIQDPVLKSGCTMLLKGMTAEDTYKALCQEFNQRLATYGIAIHLFRTTASAAPAMGLIGTLFGLIQMLSHLQLPQGIGPAMAVALLTTLYGALIAHAIATPLAEKLTIRSHTQDIYKRIALEAITGLHDGISPQGLELSLLRYLPEGQVLHQAELSASHDTTELVEILK